MYLAFCANDAYIDYTAITLYSLLQHNQQRHITAYVLSSDISEYHEHKLKKLETIFSNVTIEIVKVEASAFDGLPLNRSHIQRLEVYFRMSLTRLLPESVEKVLYLDSDILVQGDLSPLYDTDLDDYYIAGVCEPNSEGAFEYRRGIGVNTPEIYVNSGVLVMNLKKMRHDDIEQHLFKTGQEIKDKIILQDQDIINVALQGYIKPMPTIYNYGTMEREADSVPLKDVVIVHYTLYKPWENQGYDYWYNHETFNKYRKVQKEYLQAVEPLVSIIVPVTGNFENLTKCFDSICQQTYKNIELILSGHSQYNLGAFMDKYPNMQMISTDKETVEENAISGLLKATGKYVTIVYDNSWIDANYIFYLQKSLSEENGDIAMTGFTHFVSERGVFEYFDEEFSEDSQLKTKMLLENLQTLRWVEKYRNHQIFGKLYTNDIIRKALALYKGGYTSIFAHLCYFVAESLVIAKSRLYMIQDDLAFASVRQEKKMVEDIASVREYLNLMGLRGYVIEHYFEFYLELLYQYRIITQDEKLDDLSDYISTLIDEGELMKRLV